MSVRSPDEEAARLTHEIAARAIRRLDVLEWVILAGAVVVALLGGALVAVLGASALGWPFRPTWLVASLLLFGVPAAVGLTRNARALRDDRTRRLARPPTDEPDDR